MKNKIIALLLAVNMLSTGVISVYAETNEAVNKLQSEKENIEKEKNQLTAELKELYDTLKIKNDEISKIQSIVDELQTELNALESNINSLKSSIVETEEKISENTLNYEQKLEEEAHQKELLRSRIRRNYITNSYNEFLAIILDSTSLSEVSLKMKAIGNIFKSDQKIIEDVKAVQKELEETRLALEISKSELEQKKTELESNQKTVMEKQGVYLAQKEALDKEFETLSSLENAKQEKIKYLENKQIQIDLDIHDLLHPKEEVEYDNSINSSSGVYSMFIRPTIGRLTSQFGTRVDPITGVAGNNHTGLDIANSFGTIIRAAASGTVTFAGWNSGGYGKFVIIDHGNGVVTRYAHNQALLVSVGDYVNQGDPISEMGSTGYSTGSHLHFEIKVNGKFIDPLPVYQ